MLHPSVWIKTLTALALILLFILGCSTATSVPSITPTSTDNPTAGAIARATKLARATQDAESTSEAQATLDESATQTVGRLFSDRRNPFAPGSHL